MRRPHGSGTVAYNPRVQRWGGERSDRITRLCDLVAKEFRTKRKVGVA